MLIGTICQYVNFYLTFSLWSNIEIKFVNCLIVEDDQMLALFDAIGFSNLIFILFVMITRSLSSCLAPIKNIPTEY